MNVKINFSIPVTLFDYRVSDNPLYSFAKLKIFYVGQTADKRLFTKEFSDRLIGTLPYVPVVGFYNEEKEDFEGHKPDVQHIYGMVPEDTGVEYIKEDGKEYAVCDVILYTGRKDKTGEIASKIVGKQHSLELNPDDTTYEINKDTEGKIINIEFKTGSLLGLSVLGDEEKPAFTGSEFFNEDSELMKVFMGFKSQIQTFTKHITQRGEDMENKLFESALSFLKRAYSEKISIMYNKLYEIYGEEFYVPQLFDNYIVVGYWNGQEIEYSRLPYSENEDGDIIFEDSVTVYPRYLSKDEATLWENNMGTNASNETEEEEITEATEIEEEVISTEASDLDSETTQATDITESKKDKDDDEEEYVEDEEEEDEENYQAALVEEEAVEGTEGESVTFSSNNDEDDDLNEEEEEEAENTQIEENTFSTTLTDSEREELKTFRREKKEGLINSFEEDLSKDFLKELKEEIDKYSFDELEVILSKEFTKTIKQNKTKTSKTNAFIYNSASSQPKSDADIIMGLVNRYKNTK